MENDYAHAVLTIKDPGLWSDEGRRAVADWLRKQADKLVSEGKDYSPRFRARYITTRGRHP